jgi:hypothetical protein
MCLLTRLPSHIVLSVLYRVNGYDVQQCLRLSKELRHFLLAHVERLPRIGITTFSVCRIDLFGDYYGFELGLLLSHAGTVGYRSSYG